MSNFPYYYKKISFRNNASKQNIKTRIPDFIDSKDQVKDKDIHEKDAQEKEKMKYHADK